MTAPTDLPIQRDADSPDQHAFYQALLDAQSNAGIGLALIDEGRIVFANDAAAKLCGYSDEELRALPGFETLVHPADRERVMRNHRRRLAGEKFENRYEIGILTKGGERREAEITVTAPQDGAGKRLLVVIVDITDRKQAQLAMRLSEDRFSKVFHLSPVAASIARAADGTFLHVNEVYGLYFGWSAEEMLGKTSVELGLWPSAAVRRPWLDELRRCGMSRDYETAWRNKAGEMRNVRISATLMELGGETCVLALIHDITELRQSEFRFSQVFSVSPVATSISRLEDGRYLEVNDAFLRLFGWSREETVGRTSLDLRLWPEPAARQAWIAALTEQGTVIDYEARMLCRGGAARTVHISAEVIDFAGQRCILAFVYDITARRHAETMLREIVEGTSRVTGTEFFRALVHHLARALEVPFALLGEAHPDDPTKLRTLAFWSEDHFAAAVDYALATTPCGKVFGQTPQLFASGLRDAFPSASCALQADGAESYYGYPLTGISGEPLGVLAIMDRQPLRDSEERAALMAVFAARAAAELERQKAEAELRRSEQKFSRIFQSSPVAISITRLADGRYIEVNDAYVRQLGWPRDEMLGRTSIDIGLWPDPDKRRLWVAQLRSREHVARHDALLRDRAGSERNILISAEVLEFGGEECALSFLYDITERKQAEAEIRQLNADLEERVKRRTVELTEVNRELESFAYSISHDLRAPLRGIDGFSRLLQEEYGDRLDGQGNEYLVRVRRATQRLGTLIDDLLELSRVARHDMRRVRVDLSALMADIAEDLRRAEPERSVAIAIEPGCVAEGDPQLLRVLLENLLGNAWKYSRNNPAARIEFGREPTGDEVCYFIRDNGVGFDMAYLDKLFTPFQRLHNPTDFEGSGIGLASAARVVRRHRGSIWAESSPGQGAVFRFTLDGHD
ncbi:MAG: PAS domain S-box protein [Rhodocyclaceae bacterium]|nr:PAS domain S-box protein [Rhodocyclaceae bacterium]